MGYDGTTPDVQSVTLTSRNDGCFAVSQDGSAPGSRAACASFDPGSTAVGTLPLVTAQATIAVTADGYEPALQADQTFGDKLLTVVLTPEPSTFTGKLTLDPEQASGGDELSRAVVSVVKPAVGAGRVSITVDPETGALTWLDSNYGVAGEAWPGTYQVAAALPGYSPSTATVTCRLAGACTFGSSLELKKLGTLVVQAATGTAADPKPVDGATFTLTGNGELPVTQTAPAGSSPVTFTGVSSVPAPAYKVRVQAAGYAFADTSTLTLSCTGGPSATALRVSAGGTTTCTIFLVPLGSIGGTTYGILAKTGSQPRQPVSGVTLKARQCTGDPSGQDDQDKACAASGPTFSGVSAADGTYTITGRASEEGLKAGWWQVGAAANGYADSESYVQVSAGSEASHDVGLRADLVTLQVGVQDGPSTDAAKLVRDAEVVLTGPDGKSVTGKTPDATSGLYVFEGLVPTAYSLQVSGPKINLINQQVTLSVGVDPQTVYVRADLSASIVTGTVKGPQGSEGANKLLDGADVALGSGTGADFVVKPGVDGKDMTADTDATSGHPAGYFTFSAVPDGTFVVEVEKTGYVTFYGSVTVAHGQTISPLDIVLARVQHAVQVSVRSVHGYSLAGVAVSLTPSSSDNPAFSGQVLGAGGQDCPDKSWCTTYGSVPSGTYTIGVALRDKQHYGSLVPVDPTTGTTVTVSTDAKGGDVDATFSLTEAQLDLSVATTPLDGGTAPPTAKLKVTDADGDTVFSRDDFATQDSAQTPVPTPIFVPAGSYTLTADAGSAWKQTSPTKPIEVSSSSTAVTGAISLVQRSAEAEVKVTLDGKALVKTKASLTLTPGAGQSVPSAYASAVTSSDTGTYTFKGLPPGKWTIEASVSGIPAATKTVTLDADKTTAVTIDLPLSLDVKVTKAGKALTSAATLTLAAASGQNPPTVPDVYASTTTDDDGTRSFYNLPAGRYTLTATAGSATGSTTVTIVAGKDGNNGDGKTVTIDAK